MKSEMKKNRKKQKLAEVESRCIEREEKFMEMERVNSLLKRELHKGKAKSSYFQKTTASYSASFLKVHQNKSASLLQKFNKKMTVFKPYDLEVKEEELGAGVFGTVKVGYLKSLQQKVAVIIVDKSKLSQINILAEAAVAMEMSGHPNFVYFFGIIEPNIFAFEFIGDRKKAPSLGLVITKRIPLPHWKEICLDLIRALHHLHVTGIVHNDLHAQNILLRDCRYAKIIDFGKSTLIDNPTLYNIKPGTEKQNRYNTIHKHLAYELRNQANSYVSPKTDVYSLGYSVKKIADHITSKKLLSVALTMLSNDANERPNLPTLLGIIKKF